jgi:hypothetical protein
MEWPKAQRKTRSGKHRFGYFAQLIQLIQLFFLGTSFLGRFGQGASKFLAISAGTSLSAD